MTANGSRSVRFLHTSDVHLGADYSPELPKDALRAVVDAGLAEKVDALLIVGDFFDHNRVPDAIVQFAIDELARFGGPAIVLPGNHDCYDERSVYHRPLFRNRPANLHLILDDANPALHLEQLGLEVWGRPVVDHHPGFRPLLDAPPRARSGWRVVLAHGHFEIPTGEGYRSSPIWPDDIVATDCDYLALGHWDRMVDVSHGMTIARYSGAPYTGNGISEVLLVTLAPSRGTVVERLPLGAMARR
ncbi:MAG: metallophosphoesterase [Dehalococcoidia bacterium]